MICLTLVRRSRAVPWKVWAELRRRPHISLRFSRLPEDTGGAMFVRDGDRAWIVLDPRLTSAGRRCFTAHEMIHDELGSSCRAHGMPPAWDAVIARQEAAIDREVAARLVPAHELAAFLGQRDECRDRVEVHEVAEHFDVTEPIAELALGRLLASPMGWGEVVA